MRAWESDSPWNFTKTGQNSKPPSFFEKIIYDTKVENVKTTQFFEKITRYFWFFEVQLFKNWNSWNKFNLKLNSFPESGKWKRRNTSNFCKERTLQQCEMLHNEPIQIYFVAPTWTLRINRDWLSKNCIGNRCLRSTSNFWGSPEGSSTSRKFIGVWAR